MPQRGIRSYRRSKHERACPLGLLALCSRLGDPEKHETRDNALLSKSWKPLSIIYCPDLSGQGKFFLFTISSNDEIEIRQVCLSFRRLTK